MPASAIGRALGWRARTRPAPKARTTEPASAMLVGEWDRRCDSRDIANHPSRVTFASQVFGKVDVAGTVAVHAPVTEPNLDLATQRNDELAAGRWVPVDEGPRLGTAKHDTDCVLESGQLWMRLEAHLFNVG